MEMRTQKVKYLTYLMKLSYQVNRKITSKRCFGQVQGSFISQDGPFHQGFEMSLAYRPLDTMSAGLSEVEIYRHCEVFVKD